MKYLIFPFVLTILLGAGCSSFSPTPVPASVGDSGNPSPEGVIAYDQGFGLLPGKNPNILVDHASDTVDVTWNDLPEVPPTVTVIRRRSTLPNTTVVRNLTSALNIPVGTLGQDPSAKSMNLTWDDRMGWLWTYDANTDRLLFEKTTTSAPLTSSSVLTDDELTQAANDFLLSKGLISKDWSSPYVVFSWAEWWKQRQAEGKCMTKASLDIVRKMAREGSLDYDLLPSLAKAGSSNCVDPEFPNQQVVRYSMSKDGLAVYEQDGMPAIGGEVVIRLDTREVVRGSAELRREADRSNYLSIQPDRLTAYVKTGGVLGFPFGAKSYAVSAFHQGSLKYAAPVNGELRVFYIPAIQVEGMLTYQNGSSIKYATIVPLTREDQFEGR